MMKKKILLISQHYYPDMVSTGLHMTELTTRWKNNYPDTEIHVFVGENSREQSESKLVEHEVYQGVEINRVSNVGRHHGGLLDRLLFSIGFLIKAFMFVLKRRSYYDVLIITTNPPFLGILAMLFNMVFKLPYVIIAYDIYPQILAKMGVLKEENFVYRFWSWLNIKVYNRAEKIVSIGDDMTQVILKNMKVKDPSKISLIHNWSDKLTVFPVNRDENLFIKEHHLQDKKILLYSGTLGSTHNIEVILEAARDLRQHTDILFLFIGAGAKSKLVQDYITNSGNSNVMFLPFQPIEIISQTLSSAELAFVCLDSSYTGLSVPSKSYGLLAAKVPLVGILDSTSEIAMMIKKHDCGVVWNEATNERLSSILLRLLSDKELLDKMKENSYKTFIQHFDIDISVCKYHNLIESLNYTANSRN